jgi:hypothetical protein
MPGFASIDDLISEMTQNGKRGNRGPLPTQVGQP